MFQTVIANGTVVTDSAAFQADVGIVGEQIGAIGLGLGGERTVDASGCYVIPGGVDVHVHLQMPAGKYTSSDTFVSGTIAAACGGTTTIVDFVEPATGESLLAALAARQREADGRVVVDYGLHMTLPAWHVDNALDQIPEVVSAGVRSFKLYQAYDLLCLDDARLLAALTAVGRHGGLPILHSENGPVIDRLRAQALAEGHVEPVWHARTRPALLEGAAVANALALARQAEAPLYIVHVSCAPALEALVAARRRGQIALGETCPQYLFLTEERLAGARGERYICAPPLRTEPDNRALWGALAREELQVVSTDHCPFSVAEKAAEPDFARVPGGLPSIEARLSLVHDAVRRGRLSLPRWVQTCCTAPADLFRLPGKGHVAPGYDADLVVFDPQRAVTLSADWLHERVDWSPYEGLELAGWPRHVFSRGQMIVQDGEFTGQPGRGRFLRAGWPQ